MRASSAPNILHLLPLPLPSTLAGPKCLTKFGDEMTLRSALLLRRILERIVAKSFFSGPHFPPARRERPPGLISSKYETHSHSRTFSVQKEITYVDSNQRMALFGQFWRSWQKDSFCRESVRALIRSFIVGEGKNFRQL